MYKDGCQQKTEADAGRLSVIVPVYNVAPYLEKCITSILGQTYENLELILVDDGSTDASDVLCDAYAERDQRVKVIHQKNGGLSVARNTGLDVASGDWIGFVDGDDWILPTMYSTLITICCQENTEIACCRFHYVYPDHQSETSDTGTVRIYKRTEALEQLKWQENVRFEVCPKVFRRSCIGSARFQPGQVFEDIRFTRLTFQNLKRYAAVDQAFYQYLQKREGNTNSSFSIKKVETVSECDLFRKELWDEGLKNAANGLEAFTLDFIIRLYINAKSCGAEQWVLHRLRDMYRVRFFKAWKNPAVRHGRGMLFAGSPDLYDGISQRLHQRL